MLVVFKSPNNGDFYCDGMLSWEEIIEALQPAIDAGVISVTHECMSYADGEPKVWKAATE